MSAKLRGLKLNLYCWRNLELKEKGSKGKIQIEVWGTKSQKREVICLEQDLLLNPDDTEYFKHLGDLLAHMLCKAWNEIK